MTAEPATTAALPSHRSRVFDDAGAITHKFAYSAATIIALGLAYYHWRYEGWRETIIFASAITAALVSALTLVTRRFLFSVTVVAAFIAMIVIASDIKRRYVEMVLHAYDIVFYLTSFSTIRFLWVDHSTYLIAILAAFAGTAALGRYLYRTDCTRVPRPISAALTLVFAATALWASYAKGERRNTLFYWDNQYVASFYASWSETLETLLRGQLLEALQAQQKPLFKIPTVCDPLEKPPHIILIHQESVVPPSYFPTVSYDTLSSALMLPALPEKKFPVS